MRELLTGLLQDATAGEPMGGLRWTHKTTRNLAAALTRRGVPVGHVTVARLLRAQKYSLRSNRKRLGGKRTPTVTGSSACWGVGDGDSSGKDGRSSAWIRRKRS